MLNYDEYRLAISGAAHSERGVRRKSLKVVWLVGKSEGVGIVGIDYYRLVFVDFLREDVF